MVAPAGVGVGTANARASAAPAHVLVGVWMLAAFLPALLLAGTTLAVAGLGQDGATTALRLTARWSYLWFWMAYAGGALAATVGPRALACLGRAREWGLAFSCAQAVHAALVLWLYLSPIPHPGTGALLLFGIALLFTYLLAVLSFRPVSAALPAGLVRAIRVIGAEYIALAFIYDFAKNPFDGSVAHLLAYLPFQTMAAAAIVLRIIARARRNRADSRQSDVSGGARSHRALPER